MMEHWDVDRLWKNDEQLSYGKMDVEVVVEWSDTRERVL